MQTYETSATVEEQGRVLLDGVPFAPGTEVTVSIRPKQQTEIAPTRAADAALIAARERMRELFRSIKGFRNTPRITREELHERGSLR